MEKLMSWKELDWPSDARFPEPVIMEQPPAKPLKFANEPFESIQNDTFACSSYCTSYNAWLYE
jgi:hypothetical protein